MMKTYRQWEKSGRNLNAFLEVGDEVDPAMTDYFIETLPSETMTPQLIQTGEPYDHFRDKDGNSNAIFATLKRKDNQWFYAGLCFSGESEPAKHHLFLKKESRQPVFSLYFYRNIHSDSRYMLFHTRSQHQWFGQDKNGQVTGPLKADLVIHIMDADGKELSEEITREWAS